MDLKKLTLAVILPIFSSEAFSQEPYAEATPVPDYIRFHNSTEPGKPDVLQTAISTFRKGDHTVDLISVVHLGDGEYFKNLKQDLKAYDAVFYEMVGGPFTEEKAKISELESGEGDFANVQQLQKMATDLLGLEYQINGLDYLAPNFVHADMAANEFAEHSDGTSGMGEIIASAMKIAQSGKIKGVPTTDADANQLMSQLMGAVLTGNSNQLKRTLGPILAEAEHFVSALEEDQGTVLISRRNEIVIKKMNAHVAKRSPGIKKDAILFGAGHMPDLENRLKKLGYEKTDTNWNSSWMIEEGANRNQNAPSLDQMLKQVGGLMKMINGQ